MRGRLALAIVAAACGAAPATPPDAARVPLGMRLPPGCAGRAALHDREAAIGRRIGHVVEFFDPASWARFRAGVDWTTRCWKGAGRPMTFSVPMLPFDGSGSLRAGAAGAYDPLFRQVAAALVRDGQRHAGIRIGWEFNGRFMPWHAGGDPAAFVAYWRRIVAVMRATPGQAFRFQWVTASGPQDMAAPLAYPGDDVVDAVGSDVYNEYWSPLLTVPAVRWRWIRARPYGLDWLAGFAAAHGKPIVIPEWATGTRPDGHGGGDDALFVANMARWIGSHRVLYHSYWEQAGPTYDDRLLGGRHPAALAAFARGFGTNRAHRIST